MDVTETVLTDDELVAIAADAGSFWPGPLPTVDIEDVEALIAAALRGQRSLFVRSRVTEEGVLDAALAGVVAPLAGRMDSYSVYLADARYQRANWGFATTHYATSTGWVIEEVSAVGVHRFFGVEEGETRDYFRILLATAVEAGPEDRDEDSPVWLCIAATDAEGATVAAARRGEIRYVRLDADGRERTTTVDREPESVDAALDRLFAGSG